MKTVLIHCLLIIQFPFLLSGQCWANLFFFFFFSFSVCSPSDWGSQCCSAKPDWRGFMVYKDKKDRGGRECDTVWRQKKKKKKKIQNLHCVVLKLKLGLWHKPVSLIIFQFLSSRSSLQASDFFYIFIIKALSLSLTVDNWLALEDKRSSSLKNQSQEEQHSWFGTKDGVSNDPPVCLWQSGEKREKKFTSRCTFTAEAPACHGSVHPGRHHFLMMQCSSLHYCYGQIWFQHRGFVFSR